MGRIYVADAMLPAVRLLTQGYKQGVVGADEAFAFVADMLNNSDTGAQNMAYGMAYHKEETENEERSFPHTPFKKEEKKKEESLSSSSEKRKNIKKEFTLFPTFEEVAAYHKTLGTTEFSARKFYDYYESFGWMARGGNRLLNWKAKMREWARKDADNKQSKLNNNEQIKKTTHTGAHTGQDRDARAREMGEWLDAHYPVSHGAAGANQGSAEAADESLGADPIDSFLKAYGVDRVGMYRSMEAVERLGGKAQRLGQIAGRIGTAPVIRLTILHLDALAAEVNTSTVALSPEKLASMATALLQEYHYLTMPELMLAMNRLRSGAYGDFRGRLTTPRLMEAMKKFIAAKRAAN